MISEKKGRLILEQKLFLLKYVGNQTLDHTDFHIDAKSIEMAFLKISSFLFHKRHTGFKRYEGEQIIYFWLKCKMETACTWYTGIAKAYIYKTTLGISILSHFQPLQCCDCHPNISLTRQTI